MSHSRSAVGLRAILVLALVLISFASSMDALANRVFVSARSGNDANTCDNILAPCQTFAGAVTKLNPGGEAIVLDSGGYGAFTITQSVTIEAPAGVTAFIHPASGDAITINAGGGDVVVLRGLVLNGGAGSGITVNSAGALYVENLSISGFNATFDTVGIKMLGTTNLVMKNTDIKNCGRGLEYFATGVVTASIDHCHLDGNVVGFRSFSITGSSKTTVTNSAADNNTQYGWLAGGGTPGADVLTLESCSASGNGIDGVAASSSNVLTTVRYSDCVFSNNGSHGVEQLGSSVVLSRGNNTLAGNGGSATAGTIGSFPAM